jgi:hypothetical protein
MAQRRAGNTVKVSVSLDKRDLAALRKHAETNHGGNLSAAFADAAKLVRQREARHALVAMLGGPTLDDETASAIATEQVGVRQKRASKKRAA